jgi:hypothetical protein
MAKIEGRFLSTEEERLLKEAAATQPADWRVTIVRSGASKVFEVSVIAPSGASVTQPFDVNVSPEAVARFIRDVRFVPKP